MPTIVTPKFDIVREDIPFEQGYFYKVIFPDKHTDKGYATLYFNPLEIYQGVYDLNHVCETSLQKGLEAWDLVAHLQTFYPHGSARKSEAMRQGVGTSFLNQIIEDSVSKGARIMYTYATLYDALVTSAFESFLRKNGFEELTNFKRHYFRLL